MLPLVCCDLDGVVWRGDTTIDGAPDAIAALRAAGLRVVFVTNNSNATREQYLAKLARHGVPTEPGDLVTSAMAAAGLLRTRLGAEAVVLACAGPGVFEACRDGGFEVLDADDDPDRRVDAVVVGWHRSFDFERLRVAADAVRSGSWFVATNDDSTYPGAGGVVLPGNGSLVAAVATAGGVTPDVAGKPHAAMARLVQDLEPGCSGVMIGDRWSTDGRFAAELGWPFALVRSGIGDEAPGGAEAAFDAPDLATLVPHLLDSLRNDGVS